VGLGLTGAIPVKVGERKQLTFHDLVDSFNRLLIPGEIVVFVFLSLYVATCWGQYVNGI